MPQSSPAVWNFRVKPSAAASMPRRVSNACSSGTIRPVPDFRLVAPFEPTGDQPQAIDKLVDGLSRGLPPPDPAGRDGLRQDLHDGPDDPAAPAADARPRPQQDARRPALQRVPGVLPGQRRRVLRQLLRLLPAGGVPPAVGHVHREGLRAGTRRSTGCATPPPTRCSSGATSSSSRPCRASTAWARPRTTARPSSSCGRAGTTAATRSCAISSTSSTSATTRPHARHGSACAATRWRSARRLRGVAVRVEFFGDEVERIIELDPLTGEILAERNELDIFPATHFVTPQDKLGRPSPTSRPRWRSASGRWRPRAGRSRRAAAPAHDVRPRDAARSSATAPASRTTRATSSRREPGSRPWTLLDYFPPDFLLFVDESHMTIPQVAACTTATATRKEIARRLRLPPAVRARQPAADVRGVRGPRQPGDLRLRDARPVRARAERADRRAAASARPGSSTRRSRSARPRARSTTCSTRSAAASSAASARWSRRSRRRWPRTWPTTSRRWASRSSTCTPRSTRSSGSRSCATSGSASTTSSSASTSCARAWTCPR